MSNSKLPIYLSVFISLTGLLYLASCTNRDIVFVDPAKYPDLVDQSWLTGQPCSAPCWQGLEPGISSRDSALEIAKTLSFIDAENIAVNTRWVNYSCKEPSDRNCVGMEFDNDILYQLVLTVNYRITIERAVEEIGPPDGFYFVVANPDEWTSCDIKLLWAKKQIAISINYRGLQPVCESFFENGRFPKGLEVNYITYMFPGEIERIIENMQKSDETGEVYMQWAGFVE